MLNDSLNIRDSIQTIIKQLREKSPVEEAPKNIPAFLTQLFSGCTFEKKDFENTILSIQKVFSGNLPIHSIGFVTDNVISGSWDEQLKDNLSLVVDLLNQCGDIDSFFRQLLGGISLRFFEAHEIQNLQEAFVQKNYTVFLLLIIKHGFATLYNLPCFFAARMYEEALTYDYDSPLRFELMRLSAKEGNKQAALEYGNYVAKNGPYHEAFDYLLMAIPLPAAVWNIAYLIEHHELAPEQRKQFKAAFKLDEKLGAADFSKIYYELKDIIAFSSIFDHSEDLSCAYKTYFYLAYKGFYKGFNSMANLLVTNKVGIDTATTSINVEDLIKKYRQKAICGSNVPAICNEGSRLLKQATSSDESIRNETSTNYMLELIKTSAEMSMVRSHYNLGQYYEFLNEQGSPCAPGRDEILKTYEKALSLKADESSIYGKLLFSLGKFVLDPKEKKEYFEKAVRYEIYDAAFYYALLLFNEYADTQQTHTLYKAFQLLRDNISFMSSEIKEEAADLQFSVGLYLKKTIHDKSFDA